MRSERQWRGAFMRTVLPPLFFVINAVVTPTVSRGAEDDRGSAPFGLQWGMSSSEVRALGAELKDVRFKEYGASFSAAKLPKIIADVETVVLSFGYNDSLWRISAASKKFENDPYGYRVRARYDELANVLSEKYGRGESREHLSNGMFSKPDDFLMSIHTGNSSVYTDYRTNSLDVQLAIGASDFSTSFYKLIFENKALRSEFEKGKKTHEKNAL